MDSIILQTLAETGWQGAIILILFFANATQWWFYRKNVAEQTEKLFNLIEKTSSIITSNTDTLEKLIEFARNDEIISRQTIDKMSSIISQDNVLRELIRDIKNDIRSIEHKNHES